MHGFFSTRSFVTLYNASGRMSSQATGSDKSPPSSSEILSVRLNVHTTGQSLIHQLAQTMHVLR